MSNLCIYPSKRPPGTNYSANLENDRPRATTNPELAVWPWQYHLIITRSRNVVISLVVRRFQAVGGLEGPSGSDGYLPMENYGQLEEPSAQKRSIRWRSLFLYEFD